MVTEIQEASDKKLRIVFEKKNSCTHTNANHVYIQKKAKLESELTKTAGVNKKYKEVVNRWVEDDIRADLYGPTERQNRRLREIAIAVKKANQRENLGTDKFLQDVESIVPVFKTELDKIQELLAKIMKKLPQLHNVPLT